MLIYHLASLVTQPLMMRPVILSTCKTIITPEKKGETETTRRKSQQVGWLHLLLKDLYHLIESQNSQITCREIHCAIIWEILTFSLWLFPFLALSLSGTPFLFCAMGIWDRGAGPISFSWAVQYKKYHSRLLVFYSLSTSLWSGMQIHVEYAWDKEKLHRLTHKWSSHFSVRLNGKFCCVLHMNFQLSYLPKLEIRYCSCSLTFWHLL